MANNEENLIPLNKRSKEVQREIQEMGRTANRKKHAEKKKFKELFEAYLSREVTLSDLREQMLEFGFSEGELTNKNAMVMSQYKEALKGSTQAFVAVRDSIGEKPIDQMEISQPPVIKIERPKENESD